MKHILLVALLSSLPARAGELLVFAAISTTEAMQDLGAAFETKTGTRVHFSFAGSGELARQIVAGAPADVFLSADWKEMDRVINAGRAKHDDALNLLSNHLVIIQPRGAKPMASPEELVGVKTLALADPETVPAGSYAQRRLKILGLWDKVKSKVVPVLDVRAALAAVETGRADAAIVYATDARGHDVTVLRMSPYFIECGEIAYVVAPVDRPNNGAARAFVTFLQGAEGQAVFEKYGFVPLAKPPP